MIDSLLIANRGEIARRIIRTARRLGVRAIAVFSEADARAAHVREADEAVPIGPAAASDSYLAGDKILAAARTAGATAIHPGYGFLSENAEFADSVVASGLIWVGSPAASIRAMGFKDAAKRLMAGAGVPVTPGYLGEDQSPGRLAKEAAAIGWPVLIKAVAGGGARACDPCTGRQTSPTRWRAQNARLPQRSAMIGSCSKTRQPAASHRGPGVRRQPRRRRPPLRARLLAPAASSESDRGGAGAGNG